MRLRVHALLLVSDLRPSLAGRHSKNTVATCNVKKKQKEGFTHSKFCRVCENIDERPEHLKLLPAEEHSCSVDH